MKGKVTEEIAQSILQHRYNGHTYSQICGEIEKEFGVRLSLMSIKYTLDKIQKSVKSEIEQPEETQEETPKTEEEILYENRYEVVRMKKEHYINYAIAKQFGVSEQSVIDFLSRRRKFTPQEYRDIIHRYSSGDSIDKIAAIYNVNSLSIERLVSKNKTITTSPLVASRIKEEPDEEIEDIYDPAVVKQFTKFIQTVQYKYKDCVEKIEKFDNVRNDIYHKLELQETSQEEQLALLDKIKQASVERRELKDFIEVVEPLIQFLDVESNKKTVATLANIAGRICNSLENNKNRVYFVREEDE